MTWRNALAGAMLFLAGFGFGGARVEVALKTHCRPQIGQTLIAVQQTPDMVVCIFAQSAYGRALIYRRAK